MTTTDKVTLYIATHNTTGLKYFGKTTKYFTEIDLQENYHGSGTYWTNHLKKHGDDVTMEIYGVYSKTTVEQVALRFSRENNIVELLNDNGKKVWANMKEENGLDGTPKGYKFSEIAKKNMGNKKGVIFTEEHKKKISEAGKGRVMSEFNKIQLIKATKGVKRTKEHCENLSKALKGITVPEERKKRISETLTGRIFTEEHKKKISESNKGKKHTEESKKHLSEIAKNRPLLQCPYCDNKSTAGNAKRWHFENCKFK